MNDFTDPLDRIVEACRTTPMSYSDLKAAGVRSAPEPKKDDELHLFLDTAAGEGFVLGGVDAGDLCLRLFPERYVDGIASSGNRK